MLGVTAGSVRAYYLFDVADTIDLTAMGALGVRAHISPAYLQFPVPPLVAPLDDAEIAGMRCSSRVKIFDYGVISLRLSFDAAGSWNEYVAIAERVRSDERIAQFAETTVTDLCERYAHALDDRHAPLVEDYFLLEVDRFAEPIDAESLIDDHAKELAAALQGERSPLSANETEEALRTRFSYLEDDLTIVQWDTAFVYDRPESARAIEDILEFANSQLLELRTYDAQLDLELDSIYKMQLEKSSPSLRGRREAEQASSLRYLIVDILELMDRSTNALKVVGDAYYARIYRTAAQRLGLADWQGQVDSKLSNVSDMYQFLSDRARNRRDEFLEVIIIVLIALELIVGVATLFHH